MANKYSLVLDGTNVEELQSDDTLVNGSGNPFVAYDGSNDVTFTNDITVTADASIGNDISITGRSTGTQTTDNDGSFDLSVSNHFVCTPTANFTLTFTNHTAGQSGTIILINSGGYTVSAASTTKVMGADLLTTITTAGTYVLGYISDGTNTRIYNSGAQQ